MLKVHHFQRCLMTACPKYLSYQTCLYGHKNNVTYSAIGKTTPCISRFHILSLTCRNVDVDDMTGPGGVIISKRQKNINPQIDHDLIDQIYGKRKENLKNVLSDESYSTEEERYFKAAWQKKIIAQKEFSGTRTDTGANKSYVKLPNGSGGTANNFGMLMKTQEMDDISSRTIDLNDPNERISGQFPKDETEEDRDWRHDIPLTRYGRLGRKAFYYTKKISKLGKEGKISEAMQVLDDWMMRQDRVMPSKRTFVTLIGIVGRAGYTRKAFQLFRQMKQLGLDPPDQVFTSLFNACANCPMQDYGLKRAVALYHQMQAKGIPPNHITVKAAIKAFAFCGDFTKSFQILDETKVPLDTQCFNALLMACIADKKSGFGRAVKVMQMMKEYNIQPSHQSYNLFLRSIRDCGVGDLNALIADFGLNQEESSVPVMDLFKTAGRSCKLLTSPQENCREDKDQEGEFKMMRSFENGQDPVAVADTKSHSEFLKIRPLSHCGDGLQLDEKTIDGRTDNDIAGIAFQDRDTDNRSRSYSSLALEESCELQDAVNTASFKVKAMDSNTGMSLLNESTNFKTSLVFSSPKFVGLSELGSRQGRLMVVGGVVALTSHMKSQGIEPDIKTLTQVLACVPNDARNDAMMLNFMKSLSVQPDLDFLNDIMMRRNMRQESHSVKEILPLMSKLHMTPNMRTFAALALTCRCINDARDLLNDMKAAQVEPTVEVMGHLIYSSWLSFTYKLHLLQEMEDLTMQPSPRIISMIEKSIAVAKRHIVTAEKCVDTTSFYLQPKFQRSFKNFLKFYESWLTRTEIYRERHPWERFTDSTTSKALEQKTQ